ncbi:hypothetical protein HDU76_003741 [Blyttiomyces sp. JEL0837]|nr:hypothetical protein HDU76_003741 [Blyttiomyces sp. JEL0837]
MQTSSNIIPVLATLEDQTAITQLCGFDPLELLETVEFPNDRYERLLRVSKEARMLAIRRQDIPLADMGSLNNSMLFDPQQPQLQQQQHTNLGTSNIGSRFLMGSTNFTITDNVRIALDATNGLRPSSGWQWQQSRTFSAGGGGAAGGCGGGGERMTKKDEAILRDQLARSAAALLIQGVFRGWITRRKFVAVKYFMMTVDSLASETPLVVHTLPSVEDLTVQEKLIRKYKRYCAILEEQFQPLPTFPFFCAAKIQSIFRMYMFRQSFSELLRLSKEDKQGDAGKVVRHAIRRKAKRADVNAIMKSNAVTKIQRAWRSYYSIKIFRFYRDLIKFRERGDPSKLLKFVNPKEAKLIDGAAGIHVRFRLGGVAGTSDMKTTDGDQYQINYGVSETKTMYHLGTSIIDDPSQQQQQYQPPISSQAADINTSQFQTEMIESERDLMNAIRELEEELDHEFLMRWSEALNFDNYHRNWMGLSTTGKSDDPDTFFIDIETESHRALQGVLPHLAGEKSSHQEGEKLLEQVDLLRKLNENPGGFSPKMNGNGNIDQTIDQRHDTDDVQQHTSGRASRMLSTAGSAVSGGNGRLNSEASASTGRQSRSWSERSGKSLSDVYLTGGNDEEF